MSVLRASVFPGWRFCSFGERQREREGQKEGGSAGITLKLKSTGETGHCVSPEKRLTPSLIQSLSWSQPLSVLLLTLAPFAVPFIIFFSLLALVFPSCFTLLKDR